MEEPCTCPICTELVELQEMPQCEWCRLLTCEKCMYEGISGENICAECKEHMG